MCTLHAAVVLQVLEEAQRDLVNYKGTGMSIMEMSHRGKEYDAVIKKAEADLRKLLNIPANYKVLFLQGEQLILLCACVRPGTLRGTLLDTRKLSVPAGGASTQFSMIPYNLTKAGDNTDYVVTGAWSKKVGMGRRRTAQGRSASSSPASSAPRVHSKDHPPT